MYWVKIHKTRGEVIVAVADEDIVGKTFRGKGLQISIKPTFYCGEVVDEDVMIARLCIATIANIVGKKAVNVAIKHGLVSKESVIRIGTVPHVQIICMKS